MQINRIFLTVLISAAFLLLGCSQKKTIVISSFPNGKPQEIRELDFPITKDRSGKQTVFFQNGKVRATGKIRNGMRQGKWFCVYENGKPEWESNFIDDKENGETICHDTLGYWRKFECTNGIKNGKYTSYFYDWFDSVNCYIRGNYVNGLEQGLWTKRDTTGKLLVEMTYKDGMKNGYFANYYKNGKQRLKGFFDSKGNLTNVEHFDEAGNPKKISGSSYITREI